MKNGSTTIVAISGFSSNTGKTTLMCELLRALPGWEAIKLTRVHYRSCGKDPDTCCVSDLLGDEPLVRSGRGENYAAGKDTGRFWDAGASNVHWIIAADEKVEKGIEEALDRVQTPGVLIEGNSYLNFVDADFALVCASAEGGTIKATARHALEKADGVYVSTIADDGPTARARFASWCAGLAIDLEIDGLPIYTRDDLPELVARLKQINLAAEEPANNLQSGRGHAPALESLIP